MFSVSDGALNITNPFTEQYTRVNMIFPNKTLIVIARKYNASSSQQMALLAAMAFVGGIVAGLLIRFIYFGMFKYFVSSVDQLTSERPVRGNVNTSFVDDSFINANDQPPDYVTVMTEPSTNSNFQQQGNSKASGRIENSTIYEELPPNYKNVVPDFNSCDRSSSV